MVHASWLLNFQWALPMMNFLKPENQTHSVSGKEVLALWRLIAWRPVSRPTRFLWFFCLTSAVHDGMAQNKQKRQSDKKKIGPHGRTHVRNMKSHISQLSYSSSQENGCAWICQFFVWWFYKNLTLKTLCLKHIGINVCWLGKRRFLPELWLYWKIKKNIETATFAEHQTTKPKHQIRVDWAGRMWK